MRQLRLSRLNHLSEVTWQDSACSAKLSVFLFVDHENIFNCPFWLGHQGTRHHVLKSSLVTGLLAYISLFYLPSCPVLLLLPLILNDISVVLILNLYSVILLYIYFLASIVNGIMNKKNVMNFRGLRRAWVTPSFMLDNLSSTQTVVLHSPITSFLFVCLFAFCQPYILLSWYRSGSGLWLPACSGHEGSVSCQEELADSVLRQQGWRWGRSNFTTCLASGSCLEK